MPSIKTVTTAYSYGTPVAFLSAIALSQFVGPWALLVFLAYVMVGPFLLACPRCGLVTSGRVWTNRKGRERRSPFYHLPNPDYCSRCALDFRTHSFTAQFD